MRLSKGHKLGILVTLMAVTLAGCGTPAPAGNAPTITSVPETAIVVTAFPSTTTAPATNTPLAATPSPIAPGSGSVTPTEGTISSPVSGSVLVEGGNSMAGGVSGDTIELEVNFEASSTAGQVTEMRVDAGGFGCAREDAMSDSQWEPFAPQKVYNTTAFINIQGWYVSAQFRDASGNVSPVYCDDISIEGMPPRPTP